MLGRVCPRCGRRNAVGDRAACLYCGAPWDGGEVAAAPGLPLDPSPEPGVGRRFLGLFRLWPVQLLAFLLAFLLGLFAYKTVLEHYAPAVRARPSVKSPRRIPRRVAR